MFLCTCNNCGGVFQDTNTHPADSIDYQWADPATSHLYVEELEDHACPTCGVDDYLVDNINENALNELSREVANLFRIPTEVN